jgi:hypothetical protein
VQGFRVVFVPDESIAATCDALSGKNSCKRFGFRSRIAENCAAARIIPKVPETLRKLLTQCWSSTRMLHDMLKTQGMRHNRPTTPHTHDGELNLVDVVEQVLFVEERVFVRGISNDVRS